MVLLVRAFSLQDDVARDAILDCEAELRFVKAVLFWPEVDLDRLGQVLLLLVVEADWRHVETLWHLSEWHRLSFKRPLNQRSTVKT